MDRYSNYHFGMIINGEIHRIKIDECPSEIHKMDLPNVGHTQQYRKVYFNNYKDGQLLVVATGTGWRNIEMKEIGNIPDDLIPKVFNNINLLSTHKQGLEFKDQSINRK